MEKLKAAWKCLTETKCGRILSLALLAMFGLWLGWITHDSKLLDCYFTGTGKERIQASLIGVLIALPVFVGLWIFRTIDTWKQLIIGREQLDRGTLTNAQEAIFSKDPTKMRFGFTQLLYLREKKLFVKDIQSILKSKKDGNIDLSGLDLKGEDLKGEDLKEFYLVGANLQDAQLQNANLQNANLQGANLQGASLNDANLRE